ncbi:MAG: DUF1570 domain-containing protein [Pirellulales bacterium]|nr:DUF1570 domain-containing protein [Pirellulales bacterium]
MMHVFRRGPVAVLAVILLAGSRSAAPTDRAMVELTLDGRKIEGTPLVWNEEIVHLLGRDGRLWEFPPEAGKDYRKTADRFYAYSPSEFRGTLLQELGDDYEVSGTDHYLIAHPRGQRDRWADRFEQLYRAFVHYFSVRGFSPDRPPFPLVGVVCKDRNDFQRFAASNGNRAPRGVLGFYDQRSNRIVLYDMEGQGETSDWRKNAAVLIHEATHQTAFNTGVHSRWAAPPVWVAEGLATLFEAPGVYDAPHYPRPADRVNRGRFQDFRMLLEKGHRPELLQALIASDRLFQINPAAAYAEAWALTYFLIETQPRNYARYLALTADRPPFSEYTARQRIADFTSVFGKDWRMLEARFLRFMADVEEE